MKEKVPLIDCYTAPCQGGCPISQDIPAYLRLVSERKYFEALQVIVDKNPLPFITGTICAHPCMTKCSRQFYEGAVNIRQAKLEAAEQAYDQYLASLTKPIIKKGVTKTAVIGGGPAGISAGFLLAREGMPVTVFEKGETIGGVCSQIVPEFRISMKSVERDVQLARFMGAEFKTGQVAPDLADLRAQGYEQIIYAIGAWKSGVLSLESGSSLNALEFLKENRKNPSVNPYGKEIVVIGGGNTAMDCARAATRLPEVEKVSVVYRRDKRNMPADEEELYLALEDGVAFCELLAPITVDNRRLICEKMSLGDRDASGRRKPMGTGEFTSVMADTVIAAVGEKVDSDFYESIGIETNQWGYVEADPATLKTNLENVYVIGDAYRGPATIVEAIADATTVTNQICQVHNSHYVPDNINPDPEAVREKRGNLVPNCDLNQGNCLDCSTVCEACVDVCPNRANMRVMVKGTSQIIHIDRMCNECGNCATFCPYNSAPYKDKFTVYNTVADFEGSSNSGFVLLGNPQKLRVRLMGTVKDIDLRQELDLPHEIVSLIETILADYTFALSV